MTNAADSDLARLRAIVRTFVDERDWDQFHTPKNLAMALSVAARCDPCVGYHAKALVELGASRAQVAEALGMAVYMGGGPSLMYAAKASAAFDEFSQLSAQATA